MHSIARALGALLLTGSLALALSPGSAAVPAPAPEIVDAVHGPLSSPKSSPKMAPGRFGPVKVGMSVRRAHQTGFFDRVPDKLCGQELEFKKRWLRRGVHSYVYSDGVVSIDVDSRRVQTTRGVRVGTTLKRLRARYPRLVGPTQVQWIDGPAWWAHVRKGNRYLTFFLNSGPRPHSKVKYMAVSRDEPGGFGRGC